MSKLKCFKLRCHNLHKFHAKFHENQLTDSKPETRATKRPDVDLRRLPLDFTLREKIKLRTVKKFQFVTCFCPSERWGDVLVCTQFIMNQK